MSIYTGNQKLKKLYIGNQAVRKAYLGNQLVYSAGNIVTYHVDAGVRYQEEVGEGESCLSPKTFTPQKAGWTFVGWRTDSVASGDVLASKVMGDNPVTLYAVFAHNVTVTYYNGSTTVSRQTKSRYWNNGNAASPSFALTQAAKSGWSARGWSTSAAGNGGSTYANGATFSRDSDITLYGMYQQTISVAYAGNGATSGSVSGQSGLRYYNSGSGNAVNPSFVLRPNSFVKTNYTFTKWALGSAGGTQYAAGASVALSASTTFYALWQGVAFVWIKDYFGTLISLETSNGDKVTDYFNFAPDYSEEINTYFRCTTNAVMSRSLRKMTIKGCSYYPGTANNQNSVFAVYAGGKQVYSINRQTLDTEVITVDLPATDVAVYIRAEGHSWAWNQVPYLKVREVSFS